MPNAIVLLFTLLVITPVCTAQTQFPDTPVGNQAKSWLEVFNAADSARYKEFVPSSSRTGTFWDLKFANRWCIRPMTSGKRWS